MKKISFKNIVDYDARSKKFVVIINNKYKIRVKNKKDVIKLISYISSKIKIPKYFSMTDKYSLFIQTKVYNKFTENIHIAKNNKIWDYHIPFIKKQGESKELSKTYIAKNKN